MKMTISKWLGLAIIIGAPVAAQAANYELTTPSPMVCEGILATTNGAYRLVADDSHLNSDSDDDRICTMATIAEESHSKYALKYTLKDNEISKILKICSVGKLCRIEGDMSGLTHDVYFFVKINAVSAK
jgi:hypothetical protein